MSEPQERRRRGSKRAPPRAPVVMVSCPQCGGSVRDGELGERTKCAFCGTELHLPTLDFEPPSSSAPPAAPIEAAPAAPKISHGETRAAALIIGGIALVVLAALAFQPKTSTERSQPMPTSARDVELDGVMANANCTIDCNKPCMNIKDPSAMVDCMEKCEDKCKYVGKGTGTQCRARCSSSCVAAPDAQSRASCESGCNAACPP